MISDSTLIAINITIDIYSFITVGIILIYILHHNTDLEEKNIWLYSSFISALLNSGSDIFTWICIGTAKPWYPAALHISSFIYYFTTYSVVFFFTSYILDYLTQKGRLRTFFRRLFRIMAYGYCVLLFSTPFTGWMYIIDETNHYTRGTLFNVPVIFVAIMFVSILFLIIYNRKIIDFRKIYPFLSFYLFPYLMDLIQFFAYGITLIGVGYTISFIIIFFDMNLRLQIKLNNSIKTLREQDEKIIKLQDHTIISLSSLVEERDTDTGGHIKRTSAFVEHLATLLMEKGVFQDVIDEQYIKKLKQAAPMHDIGKIIVPDHVLKKPDRLTPDEFEQMKRHTTEGKRIISEVFDENYRDGDVFKITGEVATYHHEKWSGNGYPMGLKENEIPLSARIMALADVFDALVSPRVYKEPMSYQQAFGIIEEGLGTQFDPVIARVFLDNREDFVQINESNKD